MTSFISWLCGLLGVTEPLAVHTATGIIAAMIIFVLFVATCTLVTTIIGRVWKRL